MLNSVPLMKSMTLLLVAAIIALALVLSSPVTAEAKDQCIPVEFHPCAPKCNSGNGNDSEIDPTTLSDCDPGNSGGNNNGKD